MRNRGILTKVENNGYRRDEKWYYGDRKKGKGALKGRRKGYGGYIGGRIEVCGGFRGRWY